MYKQKNITTTFFTPFFVVAKLIYFQSNYYTCTNVFLKLEEKKKHSSASIQNECSSFNSWAF